LQYSDAAHRPAFLSRIAPHIAGDITVETLDDAGDIERQPARPSLAANIVTGPSPGGISHVDR
jgi:hypothetical protein